MTTEHTDENDRPAPNIVLVGPPGAGKSTIGRKLARELGVDLYDTDAGIEERAGRTIPEIFAADGEPEFRRMEEEVVRDAVLAGHGVVSLGGGSVLSAATRALLRDRTVVYLEISVGEGLRRTGASTNRPLLNGDDPAKKYRELMKVRRPLYREVATVRVRTDGRSPGRVVRMILAKLGLEPRPRPEDSTTDTVEPGISSSSARARRKRRRGGRGRGENQPATNTTAAESDPTASRNGHSPTSQEADGAESVKRARRNRRSRRRGRRSADSSTAATTATGISTTDAAAPNPTATQPGSSASGAAADNGPTATPRSGRRRRASRAAGAPANPAVTSQDSARSTTPDGRAAASAGSNDQPDQARPAGSPPAPGGGRSRRARARRARARAREQESARNGVAGSAPAATPPAAGGDS